MLIIQQAFYARSGFAGMPFQTDLVVMVSTIAAVVIPFIAGSVMVTRGGVWHRFTAGSAVLIASIAIGLVCDFILRAMGGLAVATPLFVEAGLPLVSTALTLVVVLMVAVRRNWWVLRMKLFVTLVVAVIALALGLLVVGTIRDGHSSDLLSFTVVLGFPMIAAYIAYRAMSGLARLERVFRVVLVFAVVGMAWVISTFTSMAIAESVVYVGTHSVEQQNTTQMMLTWATLGFVLAAYVAAIWLARPVRHVALPDEMR